MSYQYEETHPHITFKLDLRAAPPKFWAALSEAAVRCEAYSLTLLDEDIGDRLYGLAERRGALSSARIEGNPLYPAQVARLARGGRLGLPKEDKRYEYEIKNILAGYALDEPARFDSQWYKDLNKLVMRGIRDRNGMPYGVTRSVGVRVGKYRCPPADECDYLLDRLFEWLADIEPGFEIYGNATATLILKALLAHLYCAWIHPFLDGNGRSSRLLEWHILCAGGMHKEERWGRRLNARAAHELSAFYWETRTADGGYYDQLEWSRERRDDGIGFLTYAVQGFAKALSRDFGTILNNTDSLRMFVETQELLESRDDGSRERRRGGVWRG